MPQAPCRVFALRLRLTFVCLVCAMCELRWKQAKEQPTKPASSTCAFQIYNDPVLSCAAGPAKAKSPGSKKRKSAQAETEQPGKSSSASGEQNSAGTSDAGEVDDGGWEVLQVRGSGTTEAEGDDLAKADPSDESKIPHADGKKPTDDVATNPQAQADEDAHPNLEVDAAKVKDVEAAKMDEPSTTAADEALLEMEKVGEANEEPAAGQTVLASPLCFVFAICLPVCLAPSLECDRAHQEQVGAKRSRMIREWEALFRQGQGGRFRPKQGTEGRKYLHPVGPGSVRSVPNDQG